MSAVPAVVAVSVVSVLPMLLTGALAVQLRADLGLGTADVGAGVATFFVAAAAGSAALGGLVERLGCARGLRLSAAVAAVSLLGVGVAARTLPVLVAALAAGGLANAIAHPAANLALIRTVAPGRTGLFFGVKQAAIPLAALASGLAVPAVALTVGWRWAFIGAGVCAALTALAVPALPGGEGSAGAPPRRRAAGRERISPGALAPLVLVSVAAGIAAMPANALGGFLTLTLVEARFAEATAGLVLAASSAGGVVARVAIGWAADRRRRAEGRLTFVGGLILVGAAGFGLLGTAGPALLVLGALLAFAAGWGWTGLLHFAVATHQRQAPALATGIIQTGIYVGAASGPFGFGLLAQHLSIPFAWSVGAVLALVGGAIMLAGSTWMARVPARNERAPQATGGGRARPGGAPA